MYVALSRATSLNGIHILGTLESKHVKADPRVHEEYQRLRQISSITTQLTKDTDQTAEFTICLLNVRSLKKHAIDIKYDSNIMDSDLIALTETQLVPHSNDTDIKDHLYPFTLFRQDHPSDRFSSLAVCSKNIVQATHYQYFQEINGLKFVLVNNERKQSCTVLLLYRKNNTNIQQYVEHLRNILSCTDTPIDIIFGDFNINYFHEITITPLQSLMSSFDYSQVVQSPRFISAGSILDHVYLKSTCDVVKQTNVSVYYSDHEAVKVSFRLK